MKAKILVLFLVLSGLMATALPVAAENDLRWKTYDVTVDIREDGSVHVTESMVIEFNGSFSRGNATIPMGKIDAIENVQVMTGDESGATTPADVSDYRQGDDYVIDYSFEKTSGTSIRTVQLEYDVFGVIRVYPENDPPREEIRWTAISSVVTEIGTIDKASATINFPGNIEGSEATRFDPEPTSSTATSVTWEKTDMGQGDSLMTFASFPDVTDATPPSWQAEADKMEPRREKVPALAILTGIMATVGFGTLSLAMWRNGVRDPQVGMVADILAEPPDDLPAGLVGSLVNEGFSDKDMMGMLLDLDRRGIFQISEDPVSSKRKEDDPRRFHIELMQDVDDVPTWAAPMLTGLFGKSPRVGETVDFKQLKKLAEHHKSNMSRAAERALFDRGFFEEMPGSTRQRWFLRTLLGAVIVAIPIGAIVIWTKEFSVPLIVLTVVVGFLFVGSAILSSMTARKSVAGAEAAAKWKAFGRYLKQMEKEMEPSDRLALFDAYLPWAITLGFDQRSWKKWMQDDDYRWGSHQYRPWDSEWQRRYDREYGRRGSMTTVTSAQGGLPTFNPQSMSNTTMAGMQAANLSMFALLNSASSTFASGSSSSGSGTGSASVGSSGGGSRSFS